jgi:hypothetical protein
MPRLNNDGSFSNGNFSGVGGGAQTTTTTTRTTANHPSYLISSQNATKRNSSSNITPSLRTTAEYAPAPSSHNGSGLSELASLINRGAPITADPSHAPPSAGAPQQQQQRSSMQSFASPHSRNNLGRNTAGLLSPRVAPSMMKRPIASFDHSDVGLPLTTQYNNNHADATPKQPSRGSIMRAAESGKGNLLPMRGTSPTSQQPSGVQQQQQQQRIPKRQAPARSKSSGPAYSSATTLPRTRQDIGGGGDAGSPSPQPSGIKSKLAYLRRRTATASSDDEFDSASHSVRRGEFATHRNSSGGGRRSSGVSVCSTGSGGTTTIREHSNPRGRGLRGIQNQLIKLSRMKLGHVLQVVIVLAVMALVYESHHKALFATSQLIQFKEEESLLLLHLQKIEQQSIQLHENLSRLARMGINGGGGSAAAAVTDSKGLSGGGDELEDGGEGSGGREVDFDLIHKQTQQLYQMEEELNHEVKTLQSRIQLSARNHIIQEFGEGPVQVVLELDFGGNNNNEQNSSGQGPHRISILLWHDTPHAAWTWLEQIGNNIWDGAEFKWQQGHIIDAVPNHIHGSNPDDGKIEFVEHSQHSHQAWTVGVRESDKGAMGMYINLQDNSDLHKHETCVGKVIDGFDALQRLLEAARGEQDSSIAIRKATAMHYVTKKAGI